MNMRKSVIIYLGAGLLLLVAVTMLVPHINSRRNFNVFDEIQASQCAKFECNENANEVVYITSEIRTISASVSSLDLVKGGKSIDKWLYRITFNCNEISINGHEIVVVIGPDSMSINGELYTSPGGVSFESIVSFFEAKYKYFCEVGS